jgi:hypothetical protein
MKSDFASVISQAGFFAGDGGFQIDVKDHTHLAGTVITGSDQPKEKGVNQLLTGALSLTQLSGITHVSVADLLDLREYGVLVQAPAGVDQTFFPSANVLILQHAVRLRHDLDLDAHAFALAVMLCARIEELEAQLCELL